MLYLSMSDPYAGHTLGRYCAFLHALNADNDIVCTSYMFQYNSDAHAHFSFVASTDLLFRSNDQP